MDRDQNEAGPWTQYIGQLDQLSHTNSSQNRPRNPIAPLGAPQERPRASSEMARSGPRAPWERPEAPRGGPKGPKRMPGDGRRRTKATEISAKSSPGLEKCRSCSVMRSDSVIGPIFERFSRHCVTLANPISYWPCQYKTGFGPWRSWSAMLAENCMDFVQYQYDFD